MFSLKTLKKDMDGWKDVPETDKVISSFMKKKGFTGKMTCPGSPDIYQYSNGDPGDPGSLPEFDLPCREDFEYFFIDEWISEYAGKRNLRKEDIEKYRTELESAAKEAYCEDYGSFPDEDEITERYSA